MSGELNEPFTQLLLALADDKLMIGHRNSDWTGLAPILEEDIAFSSIAQDELAHAAAIYDLIAPWLGMKADDLAFGRTHGEYRCAAIVELPDEFNWALALARQFYCDHFDVLRLERLGRSRHEEIAALAKRLRAEEQVHVDHADSWVRRLGTGGEESRRRLQAALDHLAPHAAMLVEPVDRQDGLEAAGLYPPLEGGVTMFDAWRDEMSEVAGSAGITLTLEPPSPEAIGGRRGEHTDHLAELLDEMGEVYRIEPGAAW
ncbi:MAG: 1,2-phenylacetyl-CoA epoxidase subunit PaaC [Planctomycetota bacterium]|jgi:ring-1,2-phenylacetyl-CoA epoxidase subunit PaaC